MSNNENETNKIGFKPLDSVFAYHGQNYKVMTVQNRENPCFGCVAYHSPMLCTNNEFRTQSGNCLEIMREDHQDVIFTSI